MTTYSVQCGEFFHYMDPDEEWTVTGFASAEAAQEYARRFIRAHVENCRLGRTEPDAILETYYHYGNYAAAAGLDTRDWARYCAANPPTQPEDTDYKALDPAPPKAPEPADATSPT